MVLHLNFLFYLFSALCCYYLNRSELLLLSDVSSTNYYSELSRAIQVDLSKVDENVLALKDSFAKLQFDHACNIDIYYSVPFTYNTNLL